MVMSLADARLYLARGVSRQPCLQRAGIAAPDRVSQRGVRDQWIRPQEQPVPRHRARGRGRDGLQPSQRADRVDHARQGLCAILLDARLRPGMAPAARSGAHDRNDPRYFRAVRTGCRAETLDLDVQPRGWTGARPGRQVSSRYCAVSVYAARGVSGSTCQ